MSIVFGAQVDVSRDAVTRIFDHAEAVPDQLALRDGDTTFSRGELVALVEGYAGYLLGRGVGAGDVVLVEIPRSWQEVVAVLGILRCGAVYCAVDEAAPRLRAARLLETSRPAFVVGERARAAELAESAGCPVLEGPKQDLVSASADVRFLALDSEAPACIYLTSGTTGQPKAVSVPHRALARLVDGAHTYVVCGEDEHFMRIAPLAFDVSALEIFVSLCTGSSLEIFPAGPVGATELSTFLNSRGVSVAHLTAGLLRVVIEEAPSAFDSVAQLLTGGEAVSADHVRSILERRGGGLIVTNCYGPTENATITTTYTLRDPRTAIAPLPIGIPVPGSGVAVVDSNLTPVADGVAGELLVCGPGLATEYMRDPALTAEAFIDHPTLGEHMYRTGDLVQWKGGALHFLGRADRQVKIRGHRVELTEVEAELRRHPTVKDAAVTLVAGTSSGQLVSVIVPREPGEADPEHLRTFLSKSMPDYMVPDLLIEIDSLPLTVNGKTDLEYIAQLGWDRAIARKSLIEDRGLTEDGLELRIAACWSAVLGHTSFHVDDNFFEVGGDSIAAVRLLGELCSTFPLPDLGIVDIFDHPSVSEFAAFLNVKMVPRGHAP